MTGVQTCALPISVIAAAFGEADRRDPGHQREWVILIDGNNTQIEAARGSVDAAGAAITRATGVRIGKRQLEEMVRRAAAHVEAFYLSRVIKPASDGHPLVLTFDGKGIVMLPDALRPATAKAAAAAEGKLATRLSPGEKHGRKRMAELACVYDAVPVPRAPEDIISTPAQKRRKKKAQAAKAEGKGKPREPQARGKWLTASVTDDIPAVIAAAFGEADRRDPGHQREWVILIDGNNTQIEAVTAEAGSRGITVTIVIDFIHVLGYLWKAAWSFYDKGEPASEEWVADQARKILHGKARQVAAGIRRRATTYGYSPAERAGAGECARYLDNKKDHLDYARALKKGWPIATGIIEGACRHIVKDRMDITGARWGLEGAEAILRLRALIASGDFDAYWHYHLRREHQRIHHAKYRETYTLAA